MKKLDNKKNISGEYLKKIRLERKLNRTKMSVALQLKGLSITPEEIYRIETGRVYLKDFELIAYCIVLDIDMNEIKKSYII